MCGLVYAALKRISFILDAVVEANCNSVYSSHVTGVQTDGIHQYAGYNNQCHLDELQAAVYLKSESLHRNDGYRSRFQMCIS